MNILTPASVRSALKRTSASAALAAASFAFLTSPNQASAANNGVGKTPAMGWNSWFVWQKSYNYSLVEAQAAAMAGQVPGLPAGTTFASLGYNTMDMDSGWRDETTVDSNGFATPDLSKFPNQTGESFTDVVSYIHGLKLKAGLYLTPGLLKDAYNDNCPIAGTSLTVQDIVVTPLTNGNTEDSSGASYAYLIDYSNNGAAQWIQNYADHLAKDWSMDYVMFDFVGPSTKGDIPCNNTADMAQWLIADEATGAAPFWIKLSNNLETAQGSDWQTDANSYRIDDDITGTFSTDFNSRYSDGPKWLSYEGASSNGGGWGDMDSLPIGDGQYGNVNEARSVYTLWSICCSPLILADNLTTNASLGGSKSWVLNTSEIPIITNPEVIAVDQAGHIATPAKSTGVWQVKNPNGSYTVAIFNTSSSTENLSVSFSNDLGFSGSAVVRDLWARSNLGTFSGSYTYDNIPGNGCALLRVTPTTLSSYNYLATSLSYNGNGTTVSVQTDTHYNPDTWIELESTGTGKSIDFTIPSGVPAGSYLVTLEAKDNNNRGVLQMSVDGTNVGQTVDQYTSGQTYPTTAMGTVNLIGTGSHDLKLTVVTKDSASSSYYLSAYQFTLTP
jgi:alpha-galactosidase